MFKIFIFIGLVGVSAVSSSIIPPWDRSDVGFEGEPYDFTNECEHPGLMCESCKKLVQCVEAEPGQFSKIPVKDCEVGSGITCFKNKCSPDPNPRCVLPFPTFVCMHSGIFPDPFDCTVYHMCIKQEDTVSDNSSYAFTMKCQGKFGYDPVSTYCKVQLNEDTCPDNPAVPKCTESGQNGAVSGTSIYYVCLEDGKTLIPHLYMCPHGKVYGDSKCG